MSNDIKVTLVKKGDVIAADSSWNIQQVARENHKLLEIRQNLKDIADPNAPLVAIEGGYDGYYRPQQLVVDYNGPVASDNSGWNVGGKTVWMNEIVEQEGISVQGKTFLVTEVEKPEKYGPIVVTARELTDKYEIDPDGLTVKFNQNKEYTGSNYLYDIKVIGEKKPTFGPFEPKP